MTEARCVTHKKARVKRKVYVSLAEASRTKFLHHFLLSLRNLCSLPQNENAKKGFQTCTTKIKSNDLYELKHSSKYFERYKEQRKATYVSASTIRVFVTFSMVNLVFPPFPAILPIALDK